MALARLHRQLMHRAFTRQCLHPSQALCIWVLAQRGRLTQSELADVLVLSRPSVTRLLQRMERGGLVARQADATDQRQVLVELTESGHELQHRLHDAAAEYAAGALSQLSDGDREELARILPIWRRLAELQVQS